MNAGAQPREAPAPRILGDTGRTGIGPRWWVRPRALPPRGPDPLQREAVARVLTAVWGDGARDGREHESPPLARFFEAVFAPDVATARQVADRLNVGAPTLHARFYRRGLPSVKRCVATARLVRAARLGEVPGRSVYRVALELDASSAASFRRAVRGLTGLPAAEFLARHTGDSALRHFVDALVAPYRHTLRGFAPTAAGPR